MSFYKFSVELDAVSSDSDERGWYTKDLVAYGNSLEELLDDATYFLIDQDGGSIGEQTADDALATRLITDAYYKQLETGAVKI